MKGKPQYRGPATKILLLKFHPVIKFGVKIVSLCLHTLFKFDAHKDVT